MSDVRVIVNEPLEAGLTYRVTVPDEMTVAEMAEVSRRLGEMATEVGCKFLVLRGAVVFQPEGLPRWASSIR